MTYAIDTSRTISWSAGSDQWNGGTLPAYPSWGSPTGLTEGDGTTDNTSAITTALASCTANHAVTLPAGIYYVNGLIKIPSYKALRGARTSGSPWLPTADATATTLKLGSSGKLAMGTTGTPGAEVRITDHFTKGSQTIDVASGHGLSPNDWIVLFEDVDSAFVVDGGDNGSAYNWSSESYATGHFVCQYNQVASVSGNTIGLLRPLYLTYLSGCNPGLKKLTWDRVQCGIEHLRVHGWATRSGVEMIRFENTCYAWMKGVESYNSGTDNMAFHVNIQRSHGCEFRDCYIHEGRAHDGGTCYGFGFTAANSDHKVENNILRNTRHGICFEGGGAGCAVLYNYTDDEYDDNHWSLQSSRTVHAPHPHMCLYEGNIFAYIVADNIFGSSSHITFFRNHLWGDNTGTGMPYTPASDSALCTIQICKNSTYYTLVGNVLGIKGKVRNPNWTTVPLLNTTCSGMMQSEDAIIQVGCNSNDGAIQTSVRTTLLLHGNYDLNTGGNAYVAGASGVANWDSADHAIPTSLYYGTKPAFLGSLAWPGIGYDRTPIFAENAAQYRYINGSDPPAGNTAPVGTLVLSVR